MLNAGIGLVEGPIERIPLYVYRKMVAVNVDGVFFGLQAAVPALRRAGGGSIVATASLAGLVPTAPTPVYGLTKHAVVGLVRSAAIPLAEQGISLSAIAPGFADTAILARDLHKFQEANFPLLTTEEVAAVVLKAFDGPAGAVWPIQPGREAEPYSFRGVPGPRAEGFTGELPKGLFE
jgi:NAD(P)-dependent dehydrogenase (short-subunit alcohol dehydrogenase family)